MPVDSMEAPKNTSVSKQHSTSASSSGQTTNLEKKNASHSSNQNINAVPRKKAKLLRIERKQNKLLAQGKSQSEIESIMRERKQQSCVKSLEELFDKVYTGLKKLEVTQCHPKLLLVCQYDKNISLNMVLFSPIFVEIYSEQ